MADYRLHPITWKNVINYNWLRLPHVCHDIAEILFKMVLNTVTLTPLFSENQRVNYFITSNTFKDLKIPERSRNLSKVITFVINYSIQMLIIDTIKKASIKPKTRMIFHILMQFVRLFGRNIKKKIEIGDIFER